MQRSISILWALLIILLVLNLALLYSLNSARMTTIETLNKVEIMLDELANDVRETIWRTLAADNAPWTLVIVTNRESIANLCESKLYVRRSES
jgi:hypothetical protein